MESYFKTLDTLKLSHQEERKRIWDTAFALGQSSVSTPSASIPSEIIGESYIQDDVPQMLKKRKPTKTDAYLVLNMSNNATTVDSSNSKKEILKTCLLESEKNTVDLVATATSTNITSYACSGCDKKLGNKGALAVHQKFCVPYNELVKSSALDITEASVEDSVSASSNKSPGVGRTYNRGRSQRQSHDYQTKAAAMFLLGLCDDDDGNHMVTALTVPEVAAKLNIATPNIYKWRKEHERATTIRNSGDTSFEVADWVENSKLCRSRARRSKGTISSQDSVNDSVDNVV